MRRLLLQAGRFGQKGGKTWFSARFCFLGRPEAVYLLSPPKGPRDAFNRQI